MPSHADQTLTLLRSIDASLKKLVAKNETPSVAGDADLDGQYGNPVLKFLPKTWKGGDFKNRPFSECPPELLDMVASSFDWFAQKADENGETTQSGKLVAPYKRRDAARARGWAMRLRAGWTPPPMDVERDPLLDSDDPDIDPFGGDEPPF